MNLHPKKWRGWMEKSAENESFLQEECLRTRKPTTQALSLAVNKWLYVLGTSWHILTRGAFTVQNKCVANLRKSTHIFKKKMQQKTYFEAKMEMGKDILLTLLRPNVHYGRHSQYCCMDLLWQWKNQRAVQAIPVTRVSNGKSGQIWY